MKPTTASGCRAGPPSYIDGRAGTPRQLDATAGFIYQPETKNWVSGFDIFTCAGAPRLPAVRGGRATGAHQEAGQVRQVDVHAHRQEWQQ